MVIGWMAGGDHSAPWCWGWLGVVCWVEGKVGGLEGPAISTELENIFALGMWSLTENKV